MKFIIRRYEFKHFGENKWRNVSEKTVMEKLADHFDPLTPILVKMIEGYEIVTSQGIYRKIHN